MNEKYLGLICMEQFLRPLNSINYKVSRRLNMYISSNVQVREALRQKSTKLRKPASGAFAAESVISRAGLTCLRLCLAPGLCL